MSRAYQQKTAYNKGGKLLPALCNVLGFLILAAVIAVCIPLSAPQLLPFEVYHVLSGSMEPSIPVGSAVLVFEAAPEDIQPGDVIAFNREGEVVIHRVTENRFVVGQLITKGDANAEEDINPVPYADLIGRVGRHVPALGELLERAVSPVGKLYLLAVAFCGVLFHVVAGRLRARQNEGRRTEEESASASAESPTRSRRRRRVRAVVMGILMAVFLFSLGGVLLVLRQYRLDQALYESASTRYTAVSEETAAEKAEERAEEKGGEESSAPKAEVITAPISVDFAALRAESPDVVGWLYCEGTVINYPVMQASDNNYYLHRSYDGVYSAAGSIFVEAQNRPFVDANTIVYGHHMRSGAMFAGLVKWADQSYYEAHPVMWLLTPEGDYRIDLLAGYNTPAVSDTYTIFREPGEEADAYIAAAMERSDFVSRAVPDPEGRYILLSTCAYVFDNARYVLHGQLVPLGNAADTSSESP